MCKTIDENNHLKFQNWVYMLRYCDFPNLTEKLLIFPKCNGPGAQKPRRN